MAAVYIYPLLSGGVDSAVALDIAIEKYESNLEEIRPLFIDRSCSKILYKQAHKALKRELKAANSLLNNFRERWKKVHFKELEKIHIPFQWYAKAKKKKKDIFPMARNLLLIGVAALKIATDFQLTNELHKSDGIIVIGCNQEDGYDCCKDFIDSYNNVLIIAMEQMKCNPKIRIHVPLINMHKVKIIETIYKRDLGFVLDTAWSCYYGDKEPCGECEGCKEREIAIKKYWERTERR